MKYSLKKSLLAIALLATLALCIAPATAFASPLKPEAYGCSPGWVYDNVYSAGHSYYGFGTVYSQYDPYSYNITANWSETISGSRTVTATAGVTADLSAVVAGVSVSLSVAVSYTVTFSGTEGVLVPVQPGQTVHGQYSIERQVAYGHLYYRLNNCSAGTDYGTVESWTPMSSTWHLW